MHRMITANPAAARTTVSLAQRRLFYLRPPNPEEEDVMAEALVRRRELVEKHVPERLAHSPTLRRVDENAASIRDRSE